MISSACTPLADVLLALDDFADRLRCPQSGATLTRAQHDGQEVWTANQSGAAVQYPTIDGRPALVDFAHSVIDRDTALRSHGESLIARRDGRFAGAARRLMSGGNEVATAHCGDMIERLHAQSSEGGAPVVLIVGGGTRGAGAGALYDDPRIGVIAFDIYATPLVQFIADAHAIPLADRSVDAVWVQAVLEHVLDPSRVVEEIHRVLKPAGIVYAETPFMQQVHEGAFDFHRFSPSAHRWLFRAFDAIDQGTVAGPGTVLLWSWRYFIGGLTRSRLAGALAAAPFFWLRYFDRAIGARHAADGASCVFFYGRKSDRLLTVPELVSTYPGAQR
ncbi:MAG TPA: class I SAM-dependent methyltransferase [Casimicrobiaceae bacterium]|nr:class I SAM-dependent methyltransferase [Casimicrobiaceae bacterium]